MRKGTIHILSILGVLVLAASCSFEMPSEVALEGSPAFEIPGGNRVTEISEIWDVDTALDEAASGDAGITRATTAAGEPLALALDRSLIDVSIDEFAGEGLALDDLTQVIDVSYTIPEIGIAGESFASNIDPLEVPGGVTIPDQSIEGITEVDGEATAPDLQIPASGFDSVTFQAGTLSATITVDDGDSSLNSLQVTGATIQDASGNELATASGVPVNVLPSGTLSFPITGVELPSTFEVVLSLEQDTGVVLPDTSQFDLDLAFGFSADTRISGATGINFSQSVSGTYTIPLGDGAAFESATVGEGSLFIDSAFPSDWENVEASAESVRLLQGGTERVPAAEATSTTPLSLNNAALSNEDIDVEYTVAVSGTSATFSLQDGVDEVTNSVGGGIDEFSSVTVSADTFDTVETFSTSIDQQTRDLVESVVFINPVLTVSLDNQLGSDVIVDITSTTVSNGTPVTFAEETASTSEGRFSNDASTDRNWSIAPDPFFIDMATLDVEVAVKFDDGTPNNDSVTLEDVVPGNAISLSGSVTASFEADEITIASARIDGQFPEAGQDGFDFSGVADFLPSELSFDGITANLQIEIPDDPNASIDLYLRADYVDSDGVSQSIDLVGTSATPNMLELIDSGQEEELDSELQQIINARPSGLSFVYEAQVNGLTISEPGQRLAADFTGEIPFSFVASDNVELLDENDQPVVDPFTEDVFDRADGESAEIDDLIDSIESMVLNLSIENDVGIQGQIVIDEDNGAFRKELELVDGPLAIELTPEELEVVKEFPFDPTIQVFLLGGTNDDGDPIQQQILTEGEVSIGMWLATQTDLDFSFSLTGEDE